uniref:Uncharacterized protein n=1 Tax=viral metagenome TaxID=1070528 RepID=A0A6M3K5Y0_9ZZZZ
MKWTVIRIRYGEEQKYLDDDWEPFAVTSEVTTNHFQGSSMTGIGRFMMDIKSNDYIYLRRPKQNRP